MVRALDKADSMLTLSRALQFREPFTILPFTQVPAMCSVISLCSRNSSIIPRRQSPSMCWRWGSLLVVSLSNWSTLGYRAASWNGLSASVRTATPLSTFRHSVTKDLRVAQCFC